jgi:hypothetical protein
MNASQTLISRLGISLDHSSHPGYLGNFLQRPSRTVYSNPSSSPKTSPLKGDPYLEIQNFTTKLSDSLQDQEISPRLENTLIDIDREELLLAKVERFFLVNKFVIKTILIFVITLCIGLLLTHSIKSSFFTAVLFSCSFIIGSFTRGK